ncbi:hypothetical protein L3X37_07495 [Sabulilitoribacter arenilitoris]|uniref:TonB C-terminal domain-containing protein n=1 Tax=Wocania arenilitoris TaxID=2044858 RepID=A0AAE3JMY8_9FLAO|nr:hypothetical protein [Wocania arenilitoris]MCF7568206.1 hypothetical protein [Wocania arenilitoris]
MKKIKSLLLVLAISISSVLSASTNKELPKSSSVAKEVAKLLKNPNLDLKEEVLVFVKFALNDNHEMVVLSVDSDNRQIDSFIKNKLNYVKLKAKSNTDKKMFVIPIRFQPSK